MPGPLTGLRVIDLTNGPVGGIATMVLADFGADVVKIERPGGDPFRYLPNSPMWLRGKRSVELDLKRKVEQERLHRLAATADIVMTSFRAHGAVDLGCDYDVLAERNSGIVYVQISGFGSYGPYVGFPGYEDVVAAKTGRMQALTGLVNREGPVFAAVQVASHAASQAAITGALAGLIARERTGLGQYIETSMLRGMLPYEQGALIRQQLADLDPAQFAGDPLAVQGRMPTIQYQPVQTRDGNWMQLGNLLRQQFDSFLAAAELHEVIVDERTQGSPAVWAPEVLEEVRDRVLTRMQDKTADEWVALFSELGNIAAHKFQTTQEAIDDPDLRDNGHVVEVYDARLGLMLKDEVSIMETVLGQVQAEPDEESGRSEQLGLLARLDRTPGEVGKAGPAVGAHTIEVLAEERERWRGSQLRPDDYEPPLAGLTVLEFASIIAAPLGASQLADLGARVIKVEPIGGDPYRQLGGGTGATRVNASKESISIDLKSEAGQEILAKLLPNVDLIISNFRPGVPERLGFGYEQAKAAQPNVVYLSMNGYGPDGPGAHRPSAHPVPGAGVGGALFQAGAGYPPVGESLEEIREISRRLFRANEVNPDPNTSMVVMSAATLALYARAKGLGGQRVFVDMFGANAYANADDFIRYRGKPDRRVPDAELYGTGPLNRLYQCKDGGWIYLGLHLEKEWEQFCQRIDSPDLAEDGRFSGRGGRDQHAEVLTDLLSELFATETADHWEELLSVVGLGCVRADGPAPATFWLTDRHAGQNGLVSPVVHARWGEMVRHGPLWKLTRSGLNLAAAPVVGQHTDAILEELGYDAATIARLHAERVVESEAVEARAGA
jgi:crotonobetainyl-CoA:carnitine CoA-transferase CaiB-like acyl-CoA transferase